MNQSVAVGCDVAALDAVPGQRKGGVQLGSLDNAGLIGAKAGKRERMRGLGGKKRRQSR